MLKHVAIFCITNFILITHANADGVFRDSVGARTTGRGGVNVGFADNGQILLDNPAAIVNMPTMGLSEFGFDLLFTDLSFSDPDNDNIGAEDNPFPVGQISVMRKLMGGNLGVGVGIFSQAGFASEYTLEGPAALAGPRHYKSIGALGRALGAVSWKATDRLALGFNAGLAASHIELEGPYFLQGPNPFAGTPTLLDLQSTGVAFSWATGLQYDLSPRTTLGVNYQSSTRFDLEGSTRVEIPGLGDSRFDSTLDMQWPQYLTVGLQHELNCWMRIGVEVTWFDWSSSFDSLDLNLRDPDSPVFQSVVGSELDESLPLRWRDTASIRFGVEHDVAIGTTLRAGYVFHNNPIPAETLTPYLQTTLEHAVSLGYGWQRNGLEIDLAYQYSFAPDQRVESSGLIGGDFDNSIVSTSAHWASASVIRRF